LNENIYKINLSRPDITGVEIKKVTEVLKTPHISRGPVVKKFEEAFAEYIGTKYAVAVNSGTSALHLIIRSLGIGENDEVITTPFSFIASANCILYEKAKPVFVDIDPSTLNIDVNQIENKITEKTKAILAVDVFGYPASWDKLTQIADKYNLKLIEDSCEALGTAFKNTKTGNFGNAAAFGFYPNKQITTGEGGIITTNDDDIAEKCYQMRNHGRANNGNWLDQEILGYNYRISDINCAMGLAQLQRIKEIINKREKIAELYNNRVSDFPDINIPCSTDDIKRSWFVYVITLKNNYTRYHRDNIIEVMGKRGIECGNYFTPIHLQPFYVKLFNYRSGDFPVTEAISQRTIALPFYNRLKKQEINYIVTNLKDIISKIKRQDRI
jgi:perosamine synthetase